jgi:hypothetical protein
MKSMIIFTPIYTKGVEAFTIVKNMTTSDATYQLRIIYTGAFFTHAEETVPTDADSQFIFDYFDAYFEEDTIDQSGAEIVTKATILRHKHSKDIVISGANIVKILSSEREAIIADIVKNSAI